jgi:hypothetical protein
VIIVMVMIIGVIFLGIFLRKNKPIVTIDAEISNFLISSAAYTSDCAQDYEPNYRSVEELAVACYAAKGCLDGRNSCDVLRDFYNEMLPKLRPAGTINSYKMNFAFLQEGNESEALPTPFLSIKSAGIDVTQTCSSTRAGRNIISISGGDIIQELELCLA